MHYKYSCYHQSVVGFAMQNIPVCWRLTVGLVTTMLVCIMYIVTLHLTPVFQDMEPDVKRE